MRSAARLPLLLETPAFAAALLLIPANLRSEGAGNTHDLSHDPAPAGRVAGEPPAAALGTPQKALPGLSTILPGLSTNLPGLSTNLPGLSTNLPREELAALHTTSVKAAHPTMPAPAPTMDVDALLDVGVPGRRPDTDPFSLNTPDLRSLRPPPPPWVHAGEIDLPRLYDEGTVDSRPLELSPWALFADKLDYRRAALNFHSRLGHDEMPLFYMPPPRETAVARKVKKVATDRMFKEIRRHLRRYWKDQFKEHPSLDYSEYEARLVQINNIGKDPSEHDYFNAEYTANEVKQGLLRKERTDAESDLPLLTWGPVTVTDSASVKFDLGTAANADEEDASIDVGGNERRKPILGGKSYEVDTSFITDVNPFRGYTRGDSRAMVRRLGFEVKVDWLTDVLSRRVVSAELECTADLEGDYGVFVSFVIHSR